VVRLGHRLRHPAARRARRPAAPPAGQGSEARPPGRHHAEQRHVRRGAAWAPGTRATRSR
jgi:hypothetical protein